MSELQKKIGRIQRREGPRMGFGQVVREQPRAMLLGVFADNGEQALQAHEAGADVVIFSGADAQAVITHFTRLKDTKAVAGARLATVTGTGAKDLEAQGCDFVIGTLSGTAAAAVDSEEVGQLVVAGPDMDDNTLRALATLGLDALFVEHTGGDMSLAQQLQLVRLASFASTPLVVTCAASAGVDQLRVLRDSGCAAVVLPAGSSADDIRGLGDRLREVPAPKKNKREGARDIAIVPSGAVAGNHEHDDDDGDDD